MVTDEIPDRFYKGLMYISGGVILLLISKSFHSFGSFIFSREEKPSQQCKLVTDELNKLCS